MMEEEVLGLLDSGRRRLSSQCHRRCLLGQEKASETSWIVRYDYDPCSQMDNA